MISFVKIHVIDFEVQTRCCPVGHFLLNNFFKRPNMSSLYLRELWKIYELNLFDYVFGKNRTELERLKQRFLYKSEVSLHTIYLVNTQRKYFIMVMCFLLTILSHFLNTTKLDWLIVDFSRQCKTQCYFSWWFEDNVKNHVHDFYFSSV